MNKIIIFFILIFPIFNVFSQSLILRELYKVDIPFNQEFRIKSFQEVYFPESIIFFSSEFINPAYKKAPPTKINCLCENNLETKCVSTTKKASDLTTLFTYDDNGKLIEVKIIGVNNLTYKFEYDSLGRPIKLFQHSDKINLIESATYEDSIVTIYTHNPNGNIQKIDQHLYSLREKKHIKKIDYKKNNKKVIITSIEPYDFNKQWITKFYLDKRGNWIKKLLYLKINSRKGKHSRTTRKIEYIDN